MHSSIAHLRFSVAALAFGLVVVAGCGGSESTDPSSTPPPDKIQFTAGQVRSLDSTGQVIVSANPTIPDLKSLVDSTLLVFTAGIEAKRVDISTNLTSAPLYVVGIHRAVSRASGSFSTWTLVGLDDPSKLANLIEVSGFAQSSTAVPPVSVSGTIGDGSGVVNAMLLQVAAGGAVTLWHANSGNVSFSSDAPGAACPGFQASTVVTCALETMHVRFIANSPTGTGG